MSRFLKHLLTVWYDIFVYVNETLVEDELSIVMYKFDTGTEGVGADKFLVTQLATSKAF
jgi:hypothetical protein